jgi:hypothetical protein
VTVDARRLKTYGRELVFGAPARDTPTPRRRTQLHRSHIPLSVSGVSERADRGTAAARRTCASEKAATEAAVDRLSTLDGGVVGKEPTEAAARSAEFTVLEQQLTPADAVSP